MRIVSYNLLADTYIRPEWYPDIPDELLEWSSRKGRLLQHILGLNGDILCLQEVESRAFDYLFLALKAQGYQGIFARKGFGRQDGCATFFRKKKVRFAGGSTLFFNDQGKSEKPSGHVALIVKFEWEHQVLGVVNTHIRWDRPDKAPEEHRGFCQVMELLSRLSQEEAAYWVLCGDFNVEDHTLLYQRIKEAGYKDAYCDLPLATMSKEGLSRIDYLFYSAGLEAHPDPVEKLTEKSLLPSSTQPSDHLALSAVFHKI